MLEPEAMHDARDVVGTLPDRVVLTAMTADEARATVQKIKTSLEDIRALLFELREREGWIALGYVSFQACIQDEFQMTKQRAYQLLSAYAVDRILAAPWEESSAFFGKRATENLESTRVDSQPSVAPIPEGHARELVPLLDRPSELLAAYAEAGEGKPNGPTAASIRAAVERRVLGPEEALSERDVIVMRAIEDSQHILDEPESEKALYALSRVRFWVHLDPRDVAEAAAEPAQDAAGYGELARWVAAIAACIEARVCGLRVVR